MIPSVIGLEISELDTPALLLNLEAFERNVKSMADHFRARGVAWRPHAKAFKAPVIAHQLLKAGAIGVTVAKVSEAEVMATAGIRDILIANLIVGPQKTARLAALQRIADVKTTVDNLDHLPFLSNAACATGVTIGVLVDVDLGMKRCGVASAEDAAQLAHRINETSGLRFDGLTGYEGHTLAIADPGAKRLAVQSALSRLIEAKRLVELSGLTCAIVSAGGTGSYQITADFPGLTEIQAGGGIFGCPYYKTFCHVEGLMPSVTILSTVIGRPAPDRAVFDIGLKAISVQRERPVIKDHPEYTVVGLSAEHAVIHAPKGIHLSIGQKVEFISEYSDLTFVLHDRVLGHRQRRVEASWELLGRGKLQ
jgi:D-serine deaminase-like pyridoxal phosphate-dependent protein